MLQVILILAGIILLLRVVYQVFIKVYGRKFVGNPYRHVSQMTQLDWLYTLGAKSYLEAVLRAIIHDLFPDKK